MNDWPFGKLNPLTYDFIMADPPWQFQLWGKGSEKSVEAHYDCMDMDAIKALPVSHLGRGDCLLWLWATAPMLREALATVDAWGFRYVTSGVWVKRTNTGKLRWGTGYRLRSCHEPFLIATLGNPQTSKAIPSVIDALAREHSRKPDAAFNLAEKMVPGARRLELFSRQSREGWDAFGNEISKFEAAE